MKSFAIVACVISLLLPATAVAKSTESFDSKTRKYIVATEACMIAVGLTIKQIQGGKASVVEVADATTQARDICDGVRSRLLGYSTGGFDKQASVAWYGVDRMKSGLNALLKYLDTNAPSKLIEARDKLNLGSSAAARGVKQINGARRAHRLRAIK